MGGYQSDFRISAIRGEDNLPSENSLGGYGVTTGTDDNIYELSLDPKLTRPYEAGLPVEVVFHSGNTESATLNIDEQGAVPLKKFDGGSLIPIENGDLKTELVYQLVFDGDCFQVLTGIPLSTGISQNREEIFSVLDENINSDSVFYLSNRNRYSVINGNLVTPLNIRLRRVGGAGQTGGTGSGGTVLKMPAMAEFGDVIAWTTHSSEGNLFFCQLSSFGVLGIAGEFTSDLDEILIMFPPYIAKTPLEIPENPVFNVPPVP
ncbi:hypothetical protein [uncultured Aquimarina sp.]|uniref:hypothetical protein n=1 Tax=uncultured Aquimarina sp. TaxID=575652 RepID=UPI00262F0F78|nr:hypothetical protein [uncultured Aquimarina sp.]